MKLKQNKKGASSIEIIIGIFMFLIIMCFMMDVLVLLWKTSVVAQTNTQIARIAGIQGGIRNSAPSGYPGGNSNYININDLSSIVENKFKSAGIKKSEWIAVIGNGKIGKSGKVQTREYDYKEFFDIDIVIDYKWTFIGNIIPGNLKGKFSSKRTTMSEWKYNYNSWSGE